MTNRDSTSSAGTNAPDAPESSDTSSRSYHVEIFLMSFAALLLEIAYTRVISYKLVYYYTYLVIGLALLGIGSGGVFVAISGRLRRAATETIMLWGFLLGAASVGIGYLVVAYVRTDSLGIFDYGTKKSVANLALLLVICIALFASFVSVGVMLATLFGRRSDKIGRLYFADLLGAGLACTVVVSLIGWFGPPTVIVLAGLLLALGGLRLAIRNPLARVIGAALVVLLGVATVAPELLPYQRPDDIKGKLTDSGHYFDWSPLFRVDVIPTSPDTRLLFHDGLIGSALHRFNGDVSTLTRFNTDPRILPFAAAGRAPSDELIIGAAGGNEILASLYFKTKAIDAIELNPVTYRLITHDMAGYTGHLADNPRVNYVNDEGRSYLARRDEHYNLIWYPAPDSYSATNAATAGAFVLSESYLYTREAIEDSLNHLRPNGLVTAQFGEVDYAAKPTRTARYVATARAALDHLGIHNPADHILVVTSPTEPPASLATILVKRAKFTKVEVDRVLRAIAAVPGAALHYAPGHVIAGDPASELATLPDSKLNAFYDSYPYSVRPVTDDRPFFWHFKGFGDVISGFTDSINPKNPELGVGERVLVMLLVVAVAFAAVFLLLPFLAIRRTWTKLPRKGASAIYFGALGLGFIFFEITLIQRLILYLGYPTLSLTVTLASLLLFTGVGALASGRYTEKVRRIVPIMIGALVALTAFYQFGLTPLTDATLGWSIAGRILLAFVVLAPLGVCLGTFMPVGLGTVAGLTEYPREYVAWGWAVNGFASVVGAVGSTMLAMTYGFRVVLIIALGLYLVAFLALQALLRTRATTAEPAAR